MSENDDDRFQDYDLPQACLGNVMVSVEATGGVSLCVEDPGDPNREYELICADNIDQAVIDLGQLLRVMFSRYIDKEIDPEELQRDLGGSEACLREIAHELGCPEDGEPE